MAQDPGTKAVLQLKLQESKTVSSPSRNIHRSQLGSDYSLFELETFFTRWAPDSESVAARDGPSCSFAAGDSPDCGQDGVLIVESESQPQHGSTSSVPTINERPGFSTAHARRLGPQGSRYHHICSLQQLSSVLSLFSFFFSHQCCREVHVGSHKQV